MQVRPQVFGDCRLASLLEPERPGARPPASKFVCTIGPATHDEATLRALLEAGMSCARVDLTWGPPEARARTMRDAHADAHRMRPALRRRL